MIFKVRDSLLFGFVSPHDTQGPLTKGNPYRRLCAGSLPAERRHCAGTEPSELKFLNRNLSDGSVPSWASQTALCRHSAAYEAALCRHRAVWDAKNLCRL